MNITEDNKTKRHFLNITPEKACFMLSFIPNPIANNVCAIFNNRYTIRIIGIPIMRVTIPRYSLTMNPENNELISPKSRTKLRG